MWTRITWCDATTMERTGKKRKSKSDWEIFWEDQQLGIILVLLLLHRLLPLPPFYSLNASWQSWFGILSLDKRPHVIAKTEDKVKALKEPLIRACQGNSLYKEGTSEQKKMPLIWIAPKITSFFCWTRKMCNSMEPQQSFFTGLNEASWEGK